MKNLTNINKHVRTDGTYEYYYNPENGKWEPGRFDGRKFRWIRTRKYAARHRAYTMADGSEVTYRLSRYTNRAKYRNVEAPKGKNGHTYARAIKEMVAEVYYREGRFYETYNLPTDEGKYTNSVRPFSGKIWDAYPEQSERAGIPQVAIWCNDGKPYSIELDGERIDIIAGQWEEMYVHVLEIKDVDEDRRKVVEPKSDAPAGAIEAADEWMAAITKPEEQITIDLWASYTGAIIANAAMPAA